MWNIVLSKFIEVKERFIETFGEEKLWDYQGTTCIEYWINKLNDRELIDIFQNLEVTEHKNLLLIRYGMYANIFGGESEIDFMDFFDMFDGFYMECRSVVIDTKNNALVLTPFRKFRNLNECEETSEHRIKELIRKAKCVEISDKLDGSMQSARYYNNEFIMAGTHSLDTEKSWRLKDGYNKLDERHKNMLKDNPCKTFIFENISLRDAHVVKYTADQEGLYLIGIRDVMTGKESSYKEVLEYAARYNVLTTSVFSKTFEEVLNELDDKKSSEAEGFVINIDGFKVKVKYNDYVKLHSILSVMSSPNTVIRAIADNEWDDFIAKVPDAYRERILCIANKVFSYLNKYNKNIKCYYELAIKNSSDKKTFMLWINENVPKKYRGYVCSKYLGVDFNFLKKGPKGSEKYVKMKNIETELGKDE